MYNRFKRAFFTVLLIVTAGAAGYLFGSDYAFHVSFLEKRAGTAKANTVNYT
jgi:hypothetical protein